MEITDPKFLASFNWIESDTPSIVFPGKSEMSAEGNHQALTFHQACRPSRILHQERQNFHKIPAGTSATQTPQDIQAIPWSRRSKRWLHRFRT